jgi:RND family efflux transporter MFP subunit
MLHQKMKKWIILAVVIAAGFGGYSLWNNWQKTKSTASSPARPTTATVEVRDINFAVNAAGEISPAEQVSVRPEINGLLETLPVDIGDHVKKDDLLFKLDDKELQQQRASNLTDIERARLELAKAERDHKRAQQLLAERLIAQEIYDDTKTTYDLAKNSLERAQKDLAIIEERLTKTVVRAPFDCTVLTRPVSIGQAVSGSGGFNSGTEVLSIADLNSMVINAQVNQADVPRLKVSQTVEITIEAVPGLHVNGVVERIAPQATIKNNIKGFAARIVLKNPDPRIRPGMTANVKIPVASAENVTAVPLAAVFTEKNPETLAMERFAYVQQGESFERRDVKVGVADFFYAEIQEGLSPGDVVSLELPKEELEKKAQQMARQRSPKEGAGASLRAGLLPPGTGTNATATPSSGSSVDSPPKSKSPDVQARPRREPNNTR